MADPEILKYVTQIAGLRQSAGTAGCGAGKLAASEGLGYGPPVGTGTPKFNCCDINPS